MSEFLPAIGIALGYLVGAIPSGLLIGKGFYGVDLRKQGSGNIGFTNAWRTLGKAPGIGVLVADVGKAYGSVALIPLFFAGDMAEYPLIIAFATLVGNLFNMFLGFKGGKGAASGLGVFLALVPLPMLIAFAVFLVLAFSTRYVSLGSMSGAVALPAGIAVFDGFTPTFWVAAACGAFVIFKHRGNIKRLLEGSEPKFGKKAGAAGEETSETS